MAARSLTAVLLTVTVGLPFACFASACGPVQAPRLEEICGRIFTGDVVVSELMADPQDSDTGKQYIELYNTTPRDIDLDGVSLFQSLKDGSRENSVVLSTAKIPARGYFVLGDVAANAITKPTYVGYGYAAGLGALRHADGRVGLRCGTRAIDAVSYAAVESGHALELDGSLPPDAARSAVDDNWCDASEPLDDLAPAGKNFGTPGAANSACAKVPSSGTCIDAITSAARMPKTPKVGELVLSEVMASPAMVSEADGEWFELYARADVDLNGLTIRAGSSMDALSGESCLRIAVGAYAVVARNSDAKQNGGLPTPVAVARVTLPDGASFLSLSSGDTVIDELRWTSAKKGVAWQLSQAALDAPPEDRANAFCPASRAYGQGDKGTPAAANDPCPTPISGASDVGSQAEAGASAVAATCRDAGTGLTRDPVRPRPGYLLITEVLPAPTVGDGGPGEWFEVVANANLDLNGLVLSNEGAGSTTLTSDTCLSVKAGDWLLFARSADPSINGGLPPVTATFDFALADASSPAHPERAVALGLDGTELDRATWTKSTRGTSLQRSVSELAIAAAGSTSSWCLSPSTATFGAGDRGTPAAANLSCP